MQCGRVLEDTAFSADVTFQKDAGGESMVVGQFVSETGVARGMGRIHGGRVYAYQVGGAGHGPGWAALDGGSQAGSAAAEGSTCGGRMLRPPRPRPLTHPLTHPIPQPHLAFSPLQADSHEKAQQRGRQDIAQLVDLLSVRPREESIESGEGLLGPCAPLQLPSLHACQSAVRGGAGTNLLATSACCGPLWQGVWQAVGLST